MASENEMLIKISGTAKDFMDEVDKVKKKTADLQDVLENTAKVSAVSFAAFAASIAYVTKEFANYEKALVGVGKTTDIQGKQLDNFGKKFQELSARIPVSTNELLGIAQAAGQLGVKGEESLLKFTETVAKLGVATDLSGEEAATALTRILTVTGEGVEQIDKFGSVIVALGNNFAATESEITRVATEVSRATSVFGVSAAEAAALAAALKSVGVQAELGGSAVGRAYRAIDKSIRTGGAALQNLSEITGMTGDELRKTFAENSTAVFQKFIEGLGRIQARGGDTTAALAAFKLKGEEILKVLPVLAQRSDLVGKALEMANAEMQNATALNIEAERAFSTLSSGAQILQNNVTTLATNIGSELAPSLVLLVGGISDIVAGVSEMDKGLIPLIAAFLQWGLALTGSVTAVTTAGLAYLGFTRFMAGLTVAFNVSKLAIIGWTSALTFGLTAVIAFLPEIISGFASLFKEMNKKPETEGLDEVTRKLAALQKQRDALDGAPDTGFQKNAAQISALDSEIEKWKELRNEKIKASENFGTGEMLMRPAIDGRGFDPLDGIQAQTIPLAPEEKKQDDETVKAAQDAEASKLAITKKGVQDRIDALDVENAKIKEATALKISEATAEEMAFADRRIEIEKQYSQAQKIENEELKEATLENNRLKNEALLEDEANYYLLKQEQEMLQIEQKAELDALLREMEVEQLDTFRAEDLKKLQLQTATESSVKKKAQQDEFNRRLAERKQYLEDELKYGSEIASMKQFFNSQEVVGFKDTSSQLMQLQNSKNSQMKAVGKAAAHTNAAMATAEGAIKAYSSLAGIPFIGPALGVAAAGALIAYGLEQQSQIASAATGGYVPETGGGMRDRNLTMTEPGELIIPKAIAPNFIQAAGLPDTQRAPAETEGGGGIYELVLNDRAAEMFTLEQREGRAIGTVS
jgi:TP901 family phage tail tape measure protein